MPVSVRSCVQMLSSNLEYEVIYLTPTLRWLPLPPSILEEEILGADGLSGPRRLG